MSDKDTKSTKEEAQNAKEKASEVARKIWLAGLGAYGKAFDDVKAQYDELGRETTKFFDDLVSKGLKIDEEGQTRLTEVKEKTSTTIEDRINHMKSTLTGFSIGNNDVSELSDKIDALTDKVDALVDLLSEKKADVKSATRKTSNKIKPSKSEVA